MEAFMENMLAVSIMVVLAIVLVWTAKHVTLLSYWNALREDPTRCVVAAMMTVGGLWNWRRSEELQKMQDDFLWRMMTENSLSRIETVYVALLDLAKRFRNDYDFPSPSELWLVAYRATKELGVTEQKEVERRFQFMKELLRFIKNAKSEKGEGWNEGRAAVMLDYAINTVFLEGMGESRRKAYRLNEYSMEIIRFKMKGIIEDRDTKKLYSVLYCSDGSRSVGHLWQVVLYQMIDSKSN